MIIPNENNPQNPTALIDCVYFVIIKFKSPSSIKHITFYRWFFFFFFFFFGYCIGYMFHDNFRYVCVYGKNVC